ncbi:50S ribosomal protein L25 [Paenibacillus sacheonensis]|uniref:Large ribosomal subunit protein bL25 n=1 Tax=Paenibacillus sacheonensis TaxID=742054 RepID=A0A7X4YXC2_9BACL|nr:50S ribosomal protein L25 [Paenibacillus sacheonensis]MBM7569337.1 large subunit ribosomal protein L25 [Paenibacillus sacheonensis]NBC73329.1 50S ribosomal protein L25 [Paenibacillus sacheonensis]
MAIPFQAEERKTGTQGDLRKMRLRGSVPGVVYGSKLSTPLSVAVNEKELTALLRSHPHALLELDIPGAGKQPVMLTEVQREPLSRNVLHVDFHQVNMNQEIKTMVRIEMVGDSSGVREGGILQAMLHELEIHCLPNRIPEAIEVDVTGLGIGENLLVADLKLPEGVTTRVEPDHVVVTILLPQKDLTAEEAEEAAEDAEAAAERSHEAKMEVHTSE